MVIVNREKMIVQKLLAGARISQKTPEFPFARECHTPWPDLADEFGVVF